MKLLRDLQMSFFKWGTQVCRSRWRTCLGSFCSHAVPWSPTLPAASALVSTDEGLAATCLPPPPVWLHLSTPVDTFKWIAMLLICNLIWNYIPSYIFSKKSHIMINYLFSASFPSIVSYTIKSGNMDMTQQN